MKWFIAKLVFEIASPNQKVQQYDVQFRWINAETETDALQEAFRIGHTEECILIHESGCPVQWIFKGIETLCLTEPMHNGSLLLAETIEQSIPDEFAVAVKYPACKEILQPIEVCRVL